MNSKTLFRISPFLLCLLGISAFGQNQNKTYSEKFNVDGDAVLEINTSHADIEFETWDKNEVVIEATVELTDMSEEEAERYFESPPFKIMGNSKEIEISTQGGNSFFTSHTFDDFDFHFEMPEIGPVIVDIPELDDLPEIMALHEMPPMPPMTFHKFDYEEYEKDGEKYMKKWQKEFAKGFDEEYKKKIEEWGKRMEVRAERMKERSEEMKVRAEERAQKLQERAEARAERQQAMQEERAARIKERAEARQHRNSERFMFIDTDSVRFGGPNIFYFNSDGREGNIKVKKTIKIKMPKSVKLKMNVRHGEVKLAENTKNLRATLSHARLLATTIDGNDTAIIASYSPVSVQNWNYGRLQADYSEDVRLKEVRNMTLKSTSSDITIDLLLGDLNVNNSFGSVEINSISKNFSDLDISLRNAEFVFELPNIGCNIYVNGTSSKLTTPVGLELNRTQNGDVTVHKGHYLKGSNDKSIVINSKYSEVVMER